ncbi:hypothetical protein EDD17DRAFT_1505824 [Pisolithus thermaeus]|nr:hypothetical protein EDD17DRAFT_1505824 [Pisolithus thermaeus]
MPAIRSSMHTPRHSPCKHRSALQPASAPLTPSAANMDHFHEDLLQKVTQMLEFFEQEVTRAQEEKQAVEDARVAAEKAKADAKVAEEFGAVHARAVKCHQCMNCMDHPFTCLLEQVGWKDIPAYLKQQPVTAAKLKELHDNKHIYIPWYTCPLVACQTLIERKPIEVDAAKHMICAVNTVLGAPAGQVDSGPLLQDDNIWTDVFYEADDHQILLQPVQNQPELMNRSLRTTSRQDIRHHCRFNMLQGNLIVANLVGAVSTMFRQAVSNPINERLKAVFSDHEIQLVDKKRRVLMSMGARRPTLAKTLTSLEFEKGNGSMEHKDDGKKVIWSLHHIMGGDPCRHAMFGVIIKNMEVNLWFARRAVRPRARMGPNHRVCIGGKVQYNIAMYTQGRSIGIPDCQDLF